MSDSKPTPAGLAYSFYVGLGQRTFGDIKKQTLICWRSDFYFWRDGTYGKVSNNEMKALLVKHARKNGVEPSTKLIDNTKLNLMSHCITPDNRVPNSWMDKKGDADVAVNSIVMNNGIISFDENGKIEIKEHTPDFFTFGKVPYDYDPTATCERWVQFLDEVTCGDKELQRLLQQWAGYLLVPTQKYQCFLLCLGEAATGKGTFARAMKAMLGKDNCSDIPLRRFTDNFALYLTYGKKLNVAGDAEQELTAQIEAVIKTWTGMDGLDFERKWGDPFTADATAKLMVLCNDFPTFTDKSMGTWRRLKIVPFTRDTSVIDPKLDDKLVKELPGIFNWAVEGLRDLEDSRGFVKPTVSTELWEGFKAEANPAGLFLTENYLYDREYALGVKSSMVYSTYRAWCKAKGYQPMSDRTFGKEVKRLFPLAEKRRLGGNSSRYRIYVGLKLKSGAEALDFLKKG